MKKFHLKLLPEKLTKNLLTRDDQNYSSERLQTSLVQEKAKAEVQFVSQYDMKC